jgi:hypothetical protein
MTTLSRLQARALLRNQFSEGVALPKGGIKALVAAINRANEEPPRFRFYTEINDNIRHWDERCTVIGIACACGVYGAYVLALLVLLRVV